MPVRWMVCLCRSREGGRSRRGRSRDKCQWGEGRIFQVQRATSAKGWKWETAWSEAHVSESLSTQTSRDDCFPQMRERNKRTIPSLPPLLVPPNKHSVSLIMYQAQILSLPSWNLESNRRREIHKGLKFLISTRKYNEEILYSVPRVYGTERHEERHEFMPRVLYSSIKGRRVSIKYLSTPSVFNSTPYD